MRDSCIRSSVGNTPLGLPSFPNFCVKAVSAAEDCLIFLYTCCRPLCAPTTGTGPGGQCWCCMLRSSRRSPAGLKCPETREEEEGRMLFDSHFAFE